ncbi:MAG: VCBS repeat-containing protein [Chitinophagia bacterium]|nr:VCBS repeat-containing protein [Chitinophagia bacterium]
MTKRVLFFLIAVAFSVCCYGQYMFYPEYNIKVKEAGIEKTLAWCGGFNNPQFAMADLNRDGLKDLVVFENYKGVKTFLNKGTATTPDYRYYPAYEKNFPAVYQYLVLADYNCDNIADLFEQGTTGFMVYKGYYNTANQLCFTYYQELFYTNDRRTGGPANAFNNPSDIPAIVDVDNDGDLDFLSFNILGGFINYYKNLRVENGLPCDSIKIALKDNCWGKVYQGYYRTHFLGRTCDNSSLMRTTGSASKPTHTGNTLCLFDWDMDGDYDCLDGSVSFAQMTFLKNGKREYGLAIDTIVWQDTFWQSGGKTVNIPLWPAAFNIDIDQDGKKDLLIAPNTPNTSENYNCIWFYKNYTTTGFPDWRFQSDTFLIDKALDAGSNAYPMLFDFNKDGKLDLFIGSDGYYMPATGNKESRMLYLQNTSTGGAGSFDLQRRNFLNLDTFHFRGIAPAVGDLDGDAKTDLLIGHTDGTMSFFKNIATSNAVPPVWVISQLQVTDVTGTVINADGNAAPFIYDVDRDGKPDLVIGNNYGTIQYYRNVSTGSGVFRLQLVNKELGHIKCDANQVLGCYSTPFIGKLDSATGRDYLLLGSNSGNLYKFDGIATGDTTLTYSLLDSQFSFIDSLHNRYNNPGLFSGVYANLRNAPTIGDIDGDGVLEMIVGTSTGGVNIYKRRLYDNSSVENTPQNLSINLFPNPAKDVLEVNYTYSNDNAKQVLIYDMYGRLLSQVDIPNGKTTASIDIASFANGIYICRIIGGGGIGTAQFTVVH